MNKLNLKNVIELVKAYSKVLPIDSVDKYIVHLQFYELSQIYEDAYNNPILSITSEVKYEDYILNNTFGRTILKYNIKLIVDSEDLSIEFIKIEFIPSALNKELKIEPIFKHNINGLSSHLIEEEIVYSFK